MNTTESLSVLVLKDCLMQQEAQLAKIDPTKAANAKQAEMYKNAEANLKAGILDLRESINLLEETRVEPCNKPCSPGDYYKGGKCDQNVCYEESTESSNEEKPA